jgi:hypothetical protein
MKRQLSNLAQAMQQTTQLKAEIKLLTAQQKVMMTSFSTLRMALSTPTGTSPQKNRNVTRE